MHSTAVRLLRSVVPLGLWALFATSLHGQTFKAVGTVSRAYPNRPDGLSAHRTFTAYVHEGSWLIRTTDTSTNNLVAYYKAASELRRKGRLVPATTNNLAAYYEAAFDGTDGFMHLDLKPDPTFEGITASLIIDNSPIPDEGMSPLIAPVWLALASADYFRKLTNAVISPLWTDRPTRQRMPNYAATGNWKTTNQSQAVLSEAAFYETAGWMTGPYKDGFLKQRYTVTAWTNVNGQMLPLECVLQQYAPKRLFRDGKVVLTDGKITWAGKDRDDTELFMKYKVVVNRYELGAKPARFEPTTPAQTLVQDFRFVGRRNTEDGRFLLEYFLSNQQTATNGAVRLKPVPAPTRK